MTDEPEYNFDISASFSNSLRSLLEDFQVVGNFIEVALVRKFEGNEQLVDNVGASITAFTHRLKSIDYTRKRYFSHNYRDDTPANNPPRLYVEAYQFSKKKMEESIGRLISDEKKPLSAGVFGASLVLERLRSSFWSCHLLYQLGHSYEAHAVARLILEQVSWAFEASITVEDKKIPSIKTTKSISVLKNILPEVGKLYGFLSKKTHIDYSSHMEFLYVEKGLNKVQLSHDDYKEYGEVILKLADIFCVVWEISQFQYLSKFEAVECIDGKLCPKSKRPLLDEIDNYLNKHKNC